MKTIRPPRFHVLAHVSNEERGENLDSVGCFGFNTFAAAWRYANSPEFNSSYNVFAAAARLDWEAPKFSGYIMLGGSRDGLVCAELKACDNGYSWSRYWEL